MSAASLTTETNQSRVTAVASAASKLRRDDRGGKKKSVCVRMPPIVEDMLMSAKGEGQSLPEFLRECAVMVALQRLEDSQK